MKKNILIVVNSLKLGGGAERIASEVGSKLLERGYNVTFLERYNTENRYDFEGEIISLYHKKDLDKSNVKKIIKELKTPIMIKKLCKKKSIDTIISFSFLPNLCTVLSKTILKIKDVKTIISVRNNPLKNNSETKKMLMKLLYPMADQVVALSRGVANQLNKNFYFENTTYIHNVQNIEKFKKLGKKNIVSEHKDLFDEDFIFITIGRITEQKGHWYLLRCFKKVCESKKNIKLIVLGDGNLKFELKELANRLDISEKVFFLGKVENVFPYLKKSDCFVFTSIWEGFGNVLTEALSQNLPVISTDCTAGPREILAPEIKTTEEIDYPYHGKYGILTDVFENDMFFETLEKKSLSKKEKLFSASMINIMEDKNLGDKYSDVSERVEDFDVDKIIDQWEKLI